MHALPPSAFDARSVLRVPLLHGHNASAAQLKVPVQRLQDWETASTFRRMGTQTAEQEDIRIPEEADTERASHFACHT
jgi:hypothetical protein